MSGILVLLKNNWRMLANIRRIVREQPVLKLCFIPVFGVVIIAGMWALFAEGFRFLSALGGVGLMILHRLFALFFFGLGWMLALSNVITSYAMLYSSEEMPFLLLRPIKRSELAVHKMFESGAVSSWAFFFMIIPFVGAFAARERLPVSMALWTLLFSIPFVLLCSGLGMLATLALVRWHPRLPPRVAAWGLLGAGIVAAVWFFRAGRLASPNETEFVLARLVPGMRLASHPLWPSWWVSEGILAMSRGMWARGGMFFLLLLSNLALLTMVVEIFGEAVYFDGWERSVSSIAKKRRRPVLFRPLERLLFFLPADIRALAMKDMRSMVRDPAQWTQGFLFFGLLAIYFLNIRSLRYHTLVDVWRNLVAFINVFSLSAVMCSFCSRFIYPQLSLEGHGFWLVGMSPTSMGRVLAGKYAFSCAGMAVLSAGLMLISTSMLGVPLSVRIVTLAVAAAMSLALPALATGLGAIFMDLKQRNPMAIISGFGGTLNLILSLVFMVAVITPFGVIYHRHAVNPEAAAALRPMLAAAAAWMTAATALTVFFPLWLGKRSLAAHEY